MTTVENNKVAVDTRSACKIVDQLAEEIMFSFNMKCVLTSDPAMRVALQDFITECHTSRSSS